MSHNIVLLIFEGEKREPAIFRYLRKYFIDKPEQKIIQVSYGYDIYRLSQQLKNDDGLTLLGIIQEELAKRLKQGKQLTTGDQLILELEESERVSDIYLFFDFDPHNRSANNHTLEKMLNQFDESTSEGKLYISYPMIEALRHIKNPDEQQPTYPNNKALLKAKSYKSFTADPHNTDSRFISWRDYDLDTWQIVITTHLKRSNFLVNEHFTIPQQLIEQLDILASQIEKHLSSNQIAVISAIPLMLHDYYADKLWQKFS